MTDSAGVYFAPSLPAGTYGVETKSSGMAAAAMVGVIVLVGTTVRQDFNLKVSGTTEVIEVLGGVQLVDGATVYFALAKNTMLKER